MLDIGWTELVIIGVVALIVIGPRDLPDMFRTLGRFTAKARSMSREFSRAMETAAKETGVSDVAKDIKSATSARNLGLDAVKDAASKFEKWDPLKTSAPVAAKPTTPTVAATPAPATPPVAEAAPAAAVGPATAELAEKVKARKAIAAEAAEKLRAVNIVPPSAARAAPAAPAAPTATTEAAAPAKRAGRVRKKPAKDSGEA